MAGIFQTTKDSGYRDGIKSVTIKALEQRAKQAAEAAAQSTQMQDPIANPWQGAAHLAGVFATGVNEARADRAAGAARDQLAKLQAGIKDRGNIDPATLAQIGALSPEDQKVLVEQMLAIQNREDTQAYGTSEREAGQEFTTSERLSGEKFTGGQNDLDRGLTKRGQDIDCLLYTSPSPRDKRQSRMPSSA